MLKQQSQSLFPALWNPFKWNCVLWTL